ncbi:MAG: isopenicillin N synthase family oxygenase, partial [Alphaproteobacteria bacterium]|nr:isopenicillin N synthase family oxygenase [Alphaproteobacteria bacterium]
MPRQHEDEIDHRASHRHYPEASLRGCRRPGILQCRRKEGYVSATLLAASAALADIPIVDFGAFRGGNATQRRRVAREIDRACRGTGFFYIVNHGVAPALIGRTFAEARRFFALPQAEKNRIAIAHSPCHRGYFSLGGENLDPAKQRADGDYKEGLKIGRDLPLDHPLVVAGTPLHGPNQWPEGLPGWRETMQEYYAALSALSREIMHALALGLDLKERYFDRWLTGPMATVGPLHYP